MISPAATPPPSPPTPVPTAPPPPPPTPAPAAPVPRRSAWRKPEVVVAVLAVPISLVALAYSIRATYLSSEANDIARKASQEAASHNSLEAMTSLTGSSDSLQKRFKDAGIDDVPALANFLMQLENNHRDGVIPDSFYQQQIKSWCPITRQAHDKLKIMWMDDKAFRDIHLSEPWFLARLDKMIGTEGNDKGECL